MNRIVNLVISILLLIVLTLPGCGGEEVSWSFTLGPGRLVTTVDGVTVGAPAGVLDKPIEVSILRLTGNETDEVPFPEYLADVDVIGGFYVIVSAQNFTASQGNYLILGLPVPDSVSPDDLAFVSLVPSDQIMSDVPDDSSTQWEWIYLSGVYDSDSELFATLLPSVLTEPQVFTLVSGLCVESTEDKDTQLLRQGDVTSLQILPSDFLVVSMGFNATECPEAHRQGTLEALREARKAYVVKEGFLEPNLRRVPIGISFGGVSFTLGPWVYLLVKAEKANGWYHPRTRTAWTEYPGDPDVPPDPSTAPHELFHAVQFAYESLDNNLSWELVRCMEACATTAEASLTGLTRSNWQIDGREPHDVTHPVWSSVNVSQFDYRAQDLMVYIGKALGQDLGWMKDWFKAGGLEADLDDWLTKKKLGSLGNAYWKWAKNQAFEKEIDLGPGAGGISLGPTPANGPGTGPSRTSPTLLTSAPGNQRPWSKISNWNGSTLGCSSSPCRRAAHPTR